MQADEDTNQDRRPHRLLVCALLSYNDPARAPRFLPLHPRMYLVEEGAACGRRAISHQFLLLPYESNLCCKELAAVSQRVIKPTLLQSRKS
jgi:hypothetical protein